jgi:hypothetical protein
VTAVRRVFYDLEFLDDGETITPLSIGMCDVAGRELYLINEEFPLHRLVTNEFMITHVVPSLPIMAQWGNWFESLAWDPDHPDHSRLVTRLAMAMAVRRFLVQDALPRTELWAYHAAYDHVALSQLLGPRMVDLPDGVPWFTHELMQRWEDAGRPDKPTPTNEHHPLADAKWNRQLFWTCQEALSRVELAGHRTSTYNQITGTVTGTVIQTNRDVDGGVHLPRSTVE